MNVVTVKRLDVLEKLRTNREGHRKIFLEALEGYKRMMDGALPLVERAIGELP